VESHLTADKNGEERIERPDSLSTVWRRIANSEPPKRSTAFAPMKRPVPSLMEVV
jgi:hypothetical protein